MQRHSHWDDSGSALSDKTEVALLHLLQGVLNQGDERVGADEVIGHQAELVIQILNADVHNLLVHNDRDAEHVVWAARVPHQETAVWSAFQEPAHVTNTQRPPVPRNLINGTIRVE